MSTLYEQDFYTWTQEQAASLRRAARMQLNAPVGLDWENVAEEIEDLGKSLARELFSRYRVLVAHLLKWRYQASLRSVSWRTTIINQRDEIERLLLTNSGLKPQRIKELAAAYPKARRLAIIESGLPASFFPDSCPFTLDQIEDEDFWPEPEEPAA